MYRSFVTRKFTLLLIASLILLFQNCSGHRLSEPLFDQNPKLQGGDGYPGKVYANHGDCGNDQIGVKSIIRQTSAGGFEIVRENCVDLASPIPTSANAFRYSQYDESVFVSAADVFDGRSAVSSENKLTTAFCYANAADAGLEVMIWYTSESFEGNADPRLATELFGRVTLPDQKTTGLLSFAPPQVFTDKLVYRSNPSSAPVELVETRSGLNSVVRFSFDGVEREVSLTCHAQAAPKFLEADQGYFLKLSPELSAGGTQFAVLSHVNGTDRFKKTDESSPVVSNNSLEGWNAGYLNIGGKVYEMRKQPSGSICLGPGNDPRAPCEIQVLGTIKSADFPMLYANQIRYARNLAAHLKESTAQLVLQSATNRTENMIQDYYQQCGAKAPYPKHIDYWRSSLDIQLASEVLMHLADPVEHAALRTVLLDGAEALMTALPGDILHFMTRECLPENIKTGAEILKAFESAYAATKLSSIPAFLQSKRQYVIAEIELAKSTGSTYKVDKLSSLVSAMAIVERFSSSSYDQQFESFALTNLLQAQVLESSQASCGDTLLVYGGWKRVVSGQCGHDRMSSARIVNGLMDLHGFLSSRGLCASNANCAAIQRSVLGFLAFHYKFPFSGVYEFEADVQLEQRLRIIPRLFGYAYRHGLKDSDLIQAGFSSVEKLSLSQLRLQLVTNSPTLNDYQNAVMSRGFLDARLGELTLR